MYYNGPHPLFEDGGHFIYHSTASFYCREKTKRACGLVGH